jgi:thiamine-monophosphate kinase
MSAARASEAGVVATIRRLAAGGAARGVRVGIGDDCAVLTPTPGTLLVATTDLLLENVHFRRRWAEPADIGWKALAVNLSDIASMGADPRWALVALACPETTDDEEVEAFFEGMLALAALHDVAVVGGDTTASPAGWLVNVTLLAETAAPPVLRSSARPGHVVAVTGRLGRSAAGLALLEAGAAPPEIDPPLRADLVDAHLRPRPRVAEGRWLAREGSVGAMMDLSDGLATDLQRLTAESGVGARIEVERLPIDPATRRVADGLGADPVAWATGGGEDYELLLTCPPAAFERLADGLTAVSAGARPTAIGEIVATPRVTYVDVRGREVPVRRGFEHFSSPAPGGRRA